MARPHAWLPFAFLVVALACATASGCGSGGSSGSPLTAGDAGSSSGSDAHGAGDSTLFGGDSGQTIVVDPGNLTMNATGPGSTQQFTAHYAGDTTPLTATWTLDVAGIGTIDGTGLFTASGLLGGQTSVTAQVGNGMGTTTLTVVLHINDNPGNVGAGVQAQLTAGGTADAAFKWLYPYDGTVFPRGLAAPVLQFAGTAPDATLVQVSFGSLVYQGFYGPSSPGAVTLSPQLWQTITESASGTDAVKVQLTKISAGQVTGPVSETWTIAQGSLKGTVYYNSYSSALVGGGVQNGAVLSIKPGGTAQLLIGGTAAGTCTVCHAVSADGSTLIAAHPTPSAGNSYQSSSAYDLKNNATQVYETDSTADYAFGGLYPDGSIFMSLATFASSNDAETIRRPRTSPARRPSARTRRSSSTRRPARSSRRRAGTASCRTPSHPSSRPTGPRSPSRTTTRTRGTRSPS